MFVFFMIIAALSMASASVPSNSDIIVIDPGHGGYDNGIEKFGFKEKEVVLAVSKEIETFLKKEGKGVFMTRYVDRFLSPKERYDFAGSRKPSVFLSVHMSSSSNFYVYTTRYQDANKTTLVEYYLISSRQRNFIFKSRALASSVENTLGAEFSSVINHREIPLVLLNTIGAPSVLVELPSIGVNYDDETVKRLAYTIAIGIINAER